MTQVAETILAQLGGRKFQVMTGAKYFLGGADYLQFKLPSNFAKDGINCVKVTLTPEDLYDVRFMKVRGTSLKEMGTVESVYCDMLAQVFTERTGLDTRL